MPRLALSRFVLIWISACSPEDAWLKQGLDASSWPSWAAIKLHCGETYVTTASVKRACPNGSHCVLLGFTRVPRAKVDGEFAKSLNVMCSDLNHRRANFGPVHLGPAEFIPPAATRLGTPDAPISARAAVYMAYTNWTARHEVAGHVCLPWVRVTNVEGSTTRAAVFPMPAFDWVVNNQAHMVAVRVQIPLVPAVVRPAGGLLSCTVASYVRMVLD